MSTSRCRAAGRGQTSPLGVALILGITLTAGMAIVVFGTVALEGSQGQSQVGQAEQALTQFDSQAAKVALGDSTSQRVRIGQSGGHYRVNPDAGHVWIQHVNRTEDNETELIYEAPLGEVRYDREDTVIAYQGGGVWRQDDGGSTMVSPPEFHYRQATLTFPLIRVDGTGSATGDVAARVTRTERPRQIFANASDTYPSTSDPLVNPITDGHMQVTVRSDYCRGWQSYFESRTEGEVTDCDEDGNVSADLLTFGTQGEFRVDEGADPVELRGLDDGHPLESFKLVFRAEDEEFTSSTRWTIRGTDEVGNDLQFAFRVTENDCDNSVAEMGFYFNDGADPDSYASWWINKSSGYAFECEMTANGEVIEVDLLDPDRNMTYHDVDGEGFNELEIEGSLNETESFTEHPNEHPKDPGVTYREGEFDEAPLELVVQHYFGLLDDVTMEMEVMPNGNPKITDESEGFIEYGGDGRVVTFLHITENEVEVRLD